MQRSTKFVVAVPIFLATGWLVNAQFAGSKVNKWTPTADMTVARSGACSATLADGRVLVAGGNGEKGALAAADLYNADGSFSAVASMQQSRANAACVTLQDGKVAVIGGANGTEALLSAEIYDPSNDAWTSAGNMSIARSGHRAIPTGLGAVLVLGGEESGTVEVLLTNNTFRTAGKLSKARNDYAVSRVPGTPKILIAGGSANGRALPTVDIFDADDNSITAGPDMLSPRSALAAAGLYDGTVLLSGGYDAKGLAVSSTEVYDLAKGVSHPGPNMRAARVHHEAYLLPNNGKIMIVGGTDGNAALGTSEVYSPWDGKLDQPALHHARTAMAASLQRRGGFVVAGGHDGVKTLSGSELFTFATVESDKSGNQGKRTCVNRFAVEETLEVVCQLPAEG